MGERAGRRPLNPNGRRLISTSLLTTPVGVIQFGWNPARMQVQTTAARHWAQLSHLGRKRAGESFCQSNCFLLRRPAFKGTGHFAVRPHKVPPGRHYATFCSAWENLLRVSEEFELCEFISAFSHQGRCVCFARRSPIRGGLPSFARCFVTTLKAHTALSAHSKTQRRPETDSSREAPFRPRSFDVIFDMKFRNKKWLMTLCRRCCTSSLLLNENLIKFPPGWCASFIAAHKKPKR